MAYGNWGAFVFKNEERQRDREDARVFSEHGRSGIHHAVLGGGSVRLVGYKCYPMLFVDRGSGLEEVDVSAFREDTDGKPQEGWWWGEDGRRVSGEIDGHHFEATLGGEGNQVTLELAEPDGTQWHATCGFGMGAGFE